MKKSMAAVIFTLVLIILGAFCISGTVISQEKEEAGWKRNIIMNVSRHMCGKSVIFWENRDIKTAE